MSPASTRRRRSQPSSIRALGSVLLVALAAGSVDCAQERAPISRVQENALRKSFFIGANFRDAADDPEFYMENYVVDSPTDQTLVPVGTYDDVDRIHWEVQENLLLARKAYEYVTGSDGHGRRGNRTQTGLIVAAYRIESHFDIRRAYNPQTGEELNVVEENTADRRWYDREYIRVDWSRNLVDNPDWAWLFYGSIFGDLSFSPVAYHETDPNSPNAPNFREMEPDANQPGGYFDVTSKWLVQPETSYLFREPIPTCLIANFFSGSPVYSCNPQETTIRTSYRRVEDRDFEPLELTRSPYDLVGGPRADRTGWDPAYGITDANFHRYAMIHNVWMRSHLATDVSCTSNADQNRDGTADACAPAQITGAQCDTTRRRCILRCTSNADTNNDGTADACERANHRGSQCDLVMAQCTLPYRERTVRPIPYYPNPEMPPEMQNHVVVAATDGSGADTYRLPTASDPPNTVRTGPSEQIIASWNMAINNAIAHAREVECRRIGGARDTCHAQFFENGTTPQEDGAWLGPRPKNTFRDLGTRCDGNADANRDGTADACASTRFRGAQCDTARRECVAPTPSVVLCHNPVRPEDSGHCREVGYAVRLGDIRYHHITYWPHASRARFGGIAHWGYDPLTGEIVSNGGFNMGRSVDHAAAQQRDYVLMALGELSVDSFVQGAASQRFARIVRNPAAGAPERLSDEDLESRVRAVDGSAAAQSLGVRLPRARSPEQALELHNQLVEAATPVQTPSSRTAARFEAAANLFRGTQLEAEMVDEHWLANLGFDPNATRSQSLLDQASPLRRMDPEFAENFRNQLMQRLERRGFCFQDIGAPAVVGSMDLQGVARWFRQRYPSPQFSPAERARRIYNDLRQEAYKGIALHEIGHSLGLYHVPVSSYDSMNFNPQYWQLRTRGNAARATVPCTSTCTATSCPNLRNADRNNDNCMGPRYLDPPTDDELGIADSPNPHAGINYFGNTSVMEYQWERFDETVGIGSYDHYAMGLLYGRVLETMESDPTRGGMPTDQQDNFAARLRTQLSEFDQIRWNDPVLGNANPSILPIHYTELARRLAIFDPARCRDATPAERERYRWKLIDGKLCSFGPRDHAALTDFETSTIPGSSSEREAPFWHTRADVRTGPRAVRWNYRVAWDIGTGYPHINYFDQGADPFEVTESMIRKYELTYPALYFRRGNRDFDRFSIPFYLARVIFRRLRGYHWSVARDTAFYSSVFEDATYQAVARDDNWLRPYMVAGPMIFDFFAGVMLRPEVGEYQLKEDPLPNSRPLFDVPEFADPMPEFEIGVIDGRFIGEAYDNNAGGSWDYHHWVLRTGSYPEKPIAAIMLTDTRPTFSSVTRGLFLDGREFQVNFHTDMPQAFDRLLGGILAEDWDTTAMHVPTPMPTGPGLASLQPELIPLWQRPVRGNTSGMPRRPARSRLIFPNIGYRQQLPTVVFSMLFSSLNSDLQTIHKMRIWVEGGPEQIDVPDAERIRFRNPETGITYVARSYGPDLVDNVEIDRGIASRMIAHANRLLIDTYQVEVDARLRPVVGTDGSVRVILDPQTRQPVPANRDARRQAAAVTRFRNYVGLIDATRFSSRLLGYGTLR